MEKIEEDRISCDVAFPPLPHLPPRSPRSSAKSLLHSLAGRYTATYTVTPTTSPKSSRRARDSPEVGYMRSKSYSPLRILPNVTPSPQESLPSSVSAASDSRPPSRVSSKLSATSIDDRSSHSGSVDSAFCSSCPSSPSASSSNRFGRRPPSDRSTARLSRSLSASCASDSSFDSHSSSDYSTPKRQETPSVSFRSFERRQSRRLAAPSCCSSPKSSSTPEEVMKRNSLEEWILCTVKRPTLNRRVAAMNNLTIKDNIDQYRKWLLDTPNSEKSARLTKSRNSFKFGKNKSASVGLSRASGISGKTVEVKGHSSMEDLEKQQEDVLKLLKINEKAVRENIPLYVVGFPTVVLETVISLTREIDQMSHNSNSTELASLMSRVNQTLADHALWMDYFFLHGDDSHSDQSFSTIVQNIEQAVQNLVKFAINKENQNVSNSNFSNSNETTHNNSNSSIYSQDSPYPRKKLNGSRNSHTHGSMPEIPSATSGFGNADNVPQRNVSPQPNQLTHSYSSDSILDNKENPSVYVIDCREPSSCDESAAPPIPPKKSSRERNLHCDPKIRRSYSPIGSSFDDERRSHQQMRSSGSRINCSTPEFFNTPSFEYSPNYSPATSHDSVHNTTLPPRPHHSSAEDRLGLCFNNSFDSTPVENLPSMLSRDCNNSFRSLGDDSNSSSGYSGSTMNTFSSHTFHSTPRENKLGSTSDPVKEAPQIMNSNSNQNQLTTQPSSRHSASSSSSRDSGSEIDSNVIALDVRPALPMKTRQSVNTYGSDRTQSHYDNVDRIPLPTNEVELRHHSSFESQNKSEFSKTIRYSPRSSTNELGSSISSVTSRGSSSTTINSSITRSTVHHIQYDETHTSQITTGDDAEKPRLPSKQRPPRHIMEYMQTFKNYQMPEKEWFQSKHRRSQQMISTYRAHSTTLSDDFTNFDSDSSHFFASRLSLPNSNNISGNLPPPLPPKQSRHLPCRQTVAERFQRDGLLVTDTKESLTSPEVCSYQMKNQICSCQTRDLAPVSWSSVQPTEPVELCSCQIRDLPVTSSNSAQLSEPSMMQAPRRPAKAPAETNKVKPTPRKGKGESSKNTVTADPPPPSEVTEEDESEETLLDLLNVNKYITFQGETEESDVKCASVDALVVYATYSKNGTYLEAFLTTYRTFLTPPELIAKLFYRYDKFVCISSTEYQKAAKNAFSLLVRVVHDLVVTELTNELLKDLARFECKLLSKGDLKLALYFRKKLSEKLKLRLHHQAVSDYPAHYVELRDQRQYTLLDFKYSEIAEQMTLLDSELFSKFGIPELLYYSRDENEEQCPNLATFAMQINRMSSWVKTQILKSSPHDREKYYKRFIKIMKHLRKVNNNFNSCIAILSGLESTDVRRLDWPKASTDMLKEYCDLFDFEGSYRAYRQALAETKPPCIPHLGIILQDLTKLHNINPNLMDGKVNFLKRWLQFNILEDMKRFIPSNYNIAVNENIRHFINNYEDCMSDSDLWDLSLSIKPRK